ncbi:MAG TPA: carboxypeptidase-like regulatory domain-containing protein, partial [Planctomycetota bacterium]|nr:carboxypeptidase-like regulatory domain-containing protein [Planctomycetota bacterium]
DDKGYAKLPLSETGFLYANFTWKKWGVPNSEYNQVQLNAKQGSNPVVVLLSKGGTVMGLVNGSDGKPLADAKITLNKHHYYDLESFEAMSKRGLQMDQRLTTTADKEGKFKLEGVPDGVYLVICQHDEHKTGGGQIIRVREDATVDAEAIKLSKRELGKIQFTLTADGKPLQKHKLMIDLQPVLETEAERQKHKKRQQYIGPDWNRQPDESDDAGKFTKENIPAGKYRLHIMAFAAKDEMALHQALYGGDKTEPPGMREFVMDEAVLGPDKPLELALSAVEGGTLTGTVLNAEGKPVERATITAVRESEITATGTQPFDPHNYYNEKTLHSRYARSAADGQYSLARLVPGKYVLKIAAPGGESAIVYGVEIAAGKTISAPEVKLAAPAAKPLAGDVVKGRVTSLDGKPLGGCNVSLEWRSEHGSSSHGSMSGPDGAFNFSTAGRNSDEPPTHLSVSATGYKAKVLDLATARMALDNLSIQLEKRKYCSVTFQVSDDAGKPLSGVKVSPASGVQHRWNAKKPKSKTTDRTGEATLSGIGEGKRSFTLELDGYYPAAPITAELTGDTTLKAVMKKGLSVKGKLQLPAGTALPVALVRMEKLDLQRGDPWGGNPGVSIVKAAPTGEFEVSGLAPGEYSVTVDAPSLVAPPDLKVELKEGAPTAELNVALAPAMWVVANVGAEHARSAVYVMPHGAYLKIAAAPMKYAFAYARNVRHAATVDATGRVEIYGVAPGAYDILIHPAYYSQTEIHPQFVLGPVSAQPLARPQDLATLKETPVKANAGKGSIKLKVTLETDGAPGKNITGYASVTLVGKDTASSAHANMAGPSTKKPLVIGTPPEHLKISAEPNVFTFTQLPAGEYKIYATPMWHTGRRTSANENDEPKVLRTITLKDGETLDAGELKVKMPPLDPAATPEDAMLHYGRQEEQDDLDEGFTP